MAEYRETMLALLPCIVLLRATSLGIIGALTNGTIAVDVAAIAIHLTTVSTHCDIRSCIHTNDITALGSAEPIRPCSGLCSLSIVSYVLACPVPSHRIHNDNYRRKKDPCALFCSFTTGDITTCMTTACDITTRGFSFTSTV